MAVSGHGRKPTRLRQQAIAALITQPTVELAAKACHVSYSTLNRWLQDEQFASEIAEARNKVLAGAIDRLKTASLDAVNVLTEIAKNPWATETARVNAAKFLVELALRVGAMEQLEQRIADLERGKNAGLEEFGNTPKQIEGNAEQERGDSDNECGHTGSDWEISTASNLC